MLSQLNWCVCPLFEETTMRQHMVKALWSHAMATNLDSIGRGTGPSPKGWGPPKNL